MKQKEPVRMKDTRCISIHKNRRGVDLNLTGSNIPMDLSSLKKTMKKNDKDNMNKDLSPTSNEFPIPGFF
jgi:hypothetical protein